MLAMLLVVEHFAIHLSSQGVFVGFIILFLLGLLIVPTNTEEIELLDLLCGLFR